MQVKQLSVTSILLNVKYEKNHWEQHPKRLVWCSLRNSGCKRKKQHWLFLLIFVKRFTSKIIDIRNLWQHRCMKLGMLLQTIFHPNVTRLGCKKKQEKISLTTYMNLYLSVSLLSSHISVSLHSVGKCTQCLVVNKRVKIFLKSHKKIALFCNFTRFLQIVIVKKMFLQITDVFFWNVHV